MKTTVRKWLTRWTLVLVASSASVAPALHGANVLVLSSENYDQDQKIVQILQTAGHTVTLGPTFSNFGLGVPLQNVNAVLFQINYNYNGRDMTAIAQTYLRNFVQGGGGLITVGWLNYARYYGKLQILEPVFPTTPRYDWDSRTSITYTADTLDPVLNAGLSESFTFPAASVSGGTEEVSVLKPGATRYYKTDNADTLIGLGGWTAGQGRVLSFAAMAEKTSLGDTNFAKLMGNAATAVAGSVTAKELYTGMGAYLAPRVAVSGKRNITTTKKTYRLKGSAAGYFAIARVEVKGKRAKFLAVRGGGTWTITVKLKKGKNRFPIRTVDTMGYASKSIVVSIKKKG